MRRAALAFALAALLAGCVASPGRTVTSQDARAVVERYLQAINRRDLVSLAAFATPDVEWISMANGERIVEVSGREALRQAYEEYFKQNAFTSWRIERALAADRYVAVVERAEWGEGAARAARVSMGVYEIVDGRIRRITYFLNEK